MKVHEIEEMLEDKRSIVCLTETQQKYEKVKFKDSISKIESMRGMKEKKGGGITVLYPQEDLIVLEKVPSENCDILDLKGKLCTGMLEVRIIVVYFLVQNSSEDKEKNKKMKKEIERKIESIREEALIILGDFNGHTGIIGHQSVNINGKIVLDFVTEQGLIMLNADEKCTGIYTWSQRELKSAIDFVLVNEKFYDHYVNMYIDEKKDIFDLSDHNLITTNFTVQCDKPKFNKNRWVENTYYRTDENSLNKFCKGMEESIRTNKIDNMEEFDCAMRETAETELKKTLRRKVGGKKDEIKEPPWITQEIRDAIKDRRRINRMRRNCNNPEEKERLGKQYIKQKENAADMVKGAITKHEKKTCEDIKNGENRSKKLWQNINSLKGRDVSKAEATLFDSNGNKLEKEEAKESLLEFWGKIYGKHENKIKEVWNGEIALDYQQNLYVDDFKEEQGFPIELREHMDAAVESRNKITPMIQPHLSKEKVKRTLKRLKNKKAAGPSGLKPEMYKSLTENDICLENITRCYKNELKRKEKPKTWKTSNTKMIPKKARPTIKDLRPIALTEISYKTYMSLIKDEIEEHLNRNEEMKEVQAGFTKGGKTEDNIFILQYCVEKSFKMKKPLIIASIDFSKAFDSIKREKIVEALKKYKIHPDVIESIANIYQGDKTVVKVNQDVEKEIPVTSGIRQGCTGSTVLFKLITYMILQEIEKGRSGYRDEKFNIGLLFFADDGLILSQSVEEARENIRQVITISAKYGLDINKEKSNIIATNMKDQIDDIEGIKVVDDIKYLGIKINAGRLMFRKHKKEMMEKAQKLANTTYSVIAKSCNKLMIGKTYWKSLALPSFLYGSSLINMTEKEIENLQVIENKVYRHILGAPGYTAVATLRGEIGASSMKSRIIKDRIFYVKGILDGKNDLLKEILNQMLECKDSKWMKTTQKYMEEVNLKMEDLKRKKRTQIRDWIKAWDTRKWREDTEKKSTLKIYRQFKDNVREESIYDNSPGSVILYRARANCLQLNDRKRHTEEKRTSCPLCEEDYEDLDHFLLQCGILREIRAENIMLQRPFEKESEMTIGNFLFTGNIEAAKRTLYKMWNKRKKMIATN